jgi:hypothetical protein
MSTGAWADKTILVVDDDHALKALRMLKAFDR